MATNFGMATVDFMAVVKKTLMPKVKEKEKVNNQWVVKQEREASDAEIMAFLAIADQLQLNPIIKEVYAFVSPTGGGILPVVSADGWTTLLNREKRYGGFRIITNLDAQQRLAYKTCEMVVLESSPGANDGRTISMDFKLDEWVNDTNPNWTKRPDWMLGLKAYRHTARLTFGYSGVYVDEDEAETAARFQEIEVTAESPATPIAPIRSVSEAAALTAPAATSASKPAAARPAAAAPENGDKTSDTEKRQFIQQVAEAAAATFGITVPQAVVDLCKFPEKKEVNGKKVETGNFVSRDNVAAIATGRWLDMTYHRAKETKEQLDKPPERQPGEDPDEDMTGAV